MNSRLACLVLLILAVATSYARPQNQDAKNSIESRRVEFVAAFNKGDAAALENIFEPDALLLAFTGQLITGGKGISIGMAGMSGNFDLDMKPMRFRESGDLIYEAGTWTHFRKGTKEVRQLGTFVWVWKKEKDEWRIDTLSVTASPRSPTQMKAGG